ncbi:MAG: penicillin acylase family protein [Pseudomonadales bacterium]|jgi:acyl-homoserine lactone acylase PvdQ|nr:penicillin acylase family protein [Pseudomonadales bacterium]
MSRYTERLLILLLALGLAACAPAPEETASGADAGAVPADGSDAAERARLAALAERVTIIRDDFGVPHVYGEKDADAVFGMVYAQAEDDFPRVERNYVWAVGRLAEVEGEEALFSDLRARLYMTEAEARAAYDAAPAWLRELCDAWADGLNWYLLTHPDAERMLLERFEPWMPMYFFEGSIGGDIEQIPLGGIRAFYSQGTAVEEGLPGPDVARAPFAAPPPAVAMDTQRFTEPAGSNGFALSGERTASGNALLLINPHTSFYFRGESHMVSEEGLNAYGAVTWGQFFVYQGFNEDTGWMHTSTNADFMDEFVEDVVRTEDGLKYRYGDELRDVETLDVTLRYRTEAGTAERAFTGYRTHHGPITHEQDGRWVATRINWDPVNALSQSYLRMKNADYEAFRAMMDIRTNSSNNTVYADSSGNIAYFHGNFMPRRDDAFDYSRPVDGSDPATDWQGLHTVDETVHLLNPSTGWLQNCNSTPWTAAAEASPKREDYPAYMAPDAENHRGLHAVAVLEDAEAVTLDSLVALAYDPHLPGFEHLIAGLIEAYDADSNGHAELAEEIETLRAWDLRTAADSEAMSLAHFYGLNMLETVDAPANLSRMERIDWLGTDSDPATRLEVFAATLAELERKFGATLVPWGEINRFQRLDGAIEEHYDDDAPSLPVGLASGTWGALAAYGTRRREDVDRLYGRRGNSFVAVVEFGERVRAKSLLAGGQAGDPASPHFDDQAERYVNVEFKDVPFYREDVEARAERTYHPGI